MEGLLKGLARASVSEGARIKAALDLRLKARLPAGCRLRVNEELLLCAAQKQRRTVVGHVRHALP